MSRMQTLRRKSLVLPSGALALLALACASDASSPVTDACGKYFDAVAAREARCSKSITDYRKDTRSTFLRDCLLNARAPGSGITASYLSGCSDALNAEKSACPSFSKIAACRSPSGTLADGAACGLDAQCKGALCRTSTGGSDCGVCASRIAKGAICATTSGAPSCQEGLVCLQGTCADPSAEGGPCTRKGSAAECADNLGCDGAKCVKLPGAGEACEQSCQSGLICSGTCKPPGAAGSDCPRGNECAENLACQNQKCAPITIAYPGDTCGTGVNRCDVGLECFAGELKSTCLTQIPEGGVCGSNTTECQPFLTCYKGLCQYLDPTTCK
jgi:hypothetical protein